MHIGHFETGVGRSVIDVEHEVTETHDNESLAVMEM
jgi:hypothetical protein